MANSCISDEFPDLPFWTATNSLELVNGSDMSYSASDFSSARNSLSSHAPSVIDGAEASNFYHGYVTHSSKIGTPEESGFGYQQLPSPLEDEVIIDSVMMDKERRREQNRVAQRAFRERKESRLKQLEKRIAELKVDHRSLEKKYNNLRTAHLRLQSGLRILLDASGTFDGEDTDSNSMTGDTKEA